MYFIQNLGSTTQSETIILPRQKKAYKLVLGFSKMNGLV